MTTRKRLSVQMSDDMEADMTVLVSTGMTPSQAVRLAVRLLSDGIQTAWDYEDVTKPRVPHGLYVSYPEQPGV